MAHIYSTLLIISQISFCNATVVRENVVFQKVNEIFVNDAKWLITFVHDLTPYTEFIDKVHENTNKIRNVMTEVIDQFSDQNIKSYVETFKSLEIEIQLLTETYKSVQQTFDQYTSLIVKRNKRSLIPVVGEALSFLFGTVSYSDLDNINDNIKILAKNQQKVIHDVHLSLSVLNLTRSQVAENRRALIDIVKCVHELDAEIDSVKILIDKKFNQLIKFVNTYHQFQMLIAELKSMTQNVITYLDNLKLELSMLSMNHLSINTISPSSLRKLLLEVKNQLPINYRLPENPQTNIWYYYKIVHCTTYFYKNKIQIVLNVPLLNVKHTYEIYQVINFDIPFHEKDKVHDSLTIKYKLESNFVMITKDRSKYALVSEQEVKLCKNKHTQFCNPRKALYTTNFSKYCVVALFLNNVKNIQSFCSTVVTKQNFPYARLVLNGLWVISTKEQLTFDINCKGQKKITESIMPPMGKLKLNRNCAAANEYMSFPVAKVMTSDAKIQDPLFQMLTFSNLSKFKIWKHVEKLGNLSTFVLPKHLQHLREIPTTNLFKQTDESFQTIEVNGNVKSHVYGYILCVACASIMIIVIVYCKFFKNKRTFCNVLVNDQGVNEGANENTDLQSTSQPITIIELERLHAEHDDARGVRRDD